MASYYVRKDGDDVTGDGSSGNPWLTVNKGISAIAAGDVLLIGDGLYQEDQGAGYLYISRAFASPTNIRSESGSAAGVVIMGTSSTTYDTLIACNGGNITFEDLTFAMRTSAVQNGALRIARGANLRFNRCRFQGLAGASVRYCVYVAESGAYVIQSITFEDCIMEMTGAAASYGARVMYGGSGTISGVNFINCTMTAPSYAFYATGGVNINVSGGRYTNENGLPALVYGRDAETSDTAVSGLIEGAEIASNTSHSVLIGCGAAGVTLRNCRIRGGDYGVVLKECSGNVVEGNSIIGGSAAGVYCKGAVNCTLERNRIGCSSGSCLRLGPGGTGNKNSSLLVRKNRMQAYGTAKIYSWETAGDNGGCVVDENHYGPRGSGRFGALRGSSDIKSLAELQAAWVGYTPGGNDQASRLISSSLALLLE